MKYPSRDEAINDQMAVNMLHESFSETPGYSDSKVELVN